MLYPLSYEGGGMRDYLRELRRWAAFGCLEASRVPLREFLGAFRG